MANVADYVPGDWFMAHSIDEMQEFFMSRLPAIREAARKHGYAIGLHGSARRDFDLMAMPWREGAARPDVLASAVQLAACGITAEKFFWEKKPLGRFATSMCICWTDHSEQFAGMLSVGHIDLSLIPPAEHGDPPNVIHKPSILPGVQEVSIQSTV